MPSTPFARNSEAHQISQKKKCTEVKEAGLRRVNVSTKRLLPPALFLAHRKAAQISGVGSHSQLKIIQKQHNILFPQTSCV